MHGNEESDSPVLPMKLPNKATAAAVAAEVVEGRGLAKENTGSTTRPGPSAGQGVSSGLDRVREVARRDKDAKFTALLHHVDVGRLWAAYVAIRPKAAPGVDGVTWAAYGKDLRANLEGLLARVHSGAYRASPSRRVFIPKPDGRQRLRFPKKSGHGVKRPGRCAPTITRRRWGSCRWPSRSAVRGCRS